MAGSISAIMQAGENYKECYVSVIISNNGTIVNFVNSGNTEEIYRLIKLGTMKGQHMGMLLKWQ